MIEDTKIYNGHTYSGVQLSACIDGYHQGIEDMKTDFIDMLETEFRIQNNKDSKFEETIVLKRSFIERLKEM